MIKVHSSRTVKLDQLHLRLSIIIIKHKDKENKVKHKTQTNLANITGRKQRFYLDISYLTQQKPIANLSEKITALRQGQCIQKKGKKMVKLMYIKEQRRTQKLIAIEKSIQRERILRMIHTINKGVGFKRLGIETPDAESSGPKTVKYVLRKS